MTTLAEHMIVAGADNRPLMLEKTTYNSWQNRMLLYIKRKEHGRMMLNSIEHGPLVYGTIEVDGVTRTKKYEELTDAEKLQDDCDVKATNIILQVIPQQPSVLLTVYPSPAMSQQPQAEFPQLDSGLAVPSFLPDDLPIQETRLPFKMVGLQSNKSRGDMVRVLLIDDLDAFDSDCDEAPLPFKMVGLQSNKSRGDMVRVLLIDDLDAFDSDCDEAPCAKAVLMANLFETESAVAQNTAPTEQQNAVIMSVFEETPNLVAKCNDESIQNKNVNGSLTAKLESLSKNVKDNESLKTTIVVLKTQSKEKEAKYIDKKIDFEKKIKELENIIFKVGQSVQTMHMLMKPQVFYDDTHKQALSSQVERKKVVAVTPMNKTRNVSGSQSKNNTKKNRILPAASSNKKNNTVEVHPRKVMSSSNNMNHVALCNANFKHAVKDANSNFLPVLKEFRSEIQVELPSGVVLVKSCGYLS
uniref:Integrase, catalytic region, zinc finger, CCHC-type, peptidase aspartic, catalytic n=1 Tax=Tanacetum cinerariifolium TaxID=118510 RepID=A0A6L2LS50_TANCI|nr:hypothetical protein [Tanacetum cinerariifolium]